MREHSCWTDTSKAEAAVVTSHDWVGVLQTLASKGMRLDLRVGIAEAALRQPIAVPEATQAELLDFVKRRLEQLLVTPHLPSLSRVYHSCCSRSSMQPAPPQWLSVSHVGCPTHDALSQVQSRMGADDGVRQMCVS